MIPSFAALGLPVLVWELGAGSWELGTGNQELLFGSPAPDSLLPAIKTMAAIVRATLNARH